MDTRDWAIEYLIDFGCSVNIIVMARPSVRLDNPQCQHTQMGSGSIDCRDSILL